MPIGAVPSNDFPEGRSPVISGPVELPAWMKARRDRPSNEAPPEVEFQSQPASLESTLANLEVPPVVMRKKSRRKKSWGIPKFLTQNWLVVSLQRWLSQWMSKQTAMSLSISLGLHLIVLMSLAFIVIAQVKAPEMVSIWGGDGEFGEGSGGGDEMMIDIGTPGEAGEAAPMEIDQFAQNMEAITGTVNPVEATRVGAGGKGKGEAESGVGTGGGGGGGGGAGAGFGVGGIKVPGHAQTKGSFTAWADPRDPKPGQDYFIVIRVQVPKNIKKYRATDLTGSVKGTDSYKQDIRFQPGEQFPIEDGAVVIRIRVPGGGRLVRDSIKIESKILKEKQEFEIEF